MASAAILFSEFPVSEHSDMLRLWLWCYIPNFMKIGLPVQKLLTFLFPIETHGKGGFCPLLGSKKFFQNFWPPKGTSLAQTGSFDVLCVKIGSAVWAVPWFKNPKKKNIKKCHRRMNMLGMRRGKTRRPIFSKFGTHKFWRDVMNCANFGLVCFSGFGNTGVQSYRLPIYRAHRAYNRVPTIVGTCDIVW